MTAGARRAVAFLLVLSLLLTAANLLWTSRQVRMVSRSSATITQIRAAQVAGCALANGNLARQVTLWDHLIAISKPAGTAAQRKAQAATLAGLRAYVRRVFALRDCAVLYRLQPGG